MKLRLSTEQHGLLAALAERHAVKQAEICRRAWRRGMTLAAKTPETLGVVLDDFRQSATRNESVPVEVLFPDEPYLKSFAERYEPLQLAALVAYYLQLNAAAQPLPPVTVAPEDLAELAKVPQPSDLPTLVKHAKRKLAKKGSRR